MVLEALKVMLFGMAGIFLVMGVIILSTVLLKFFQKDKAEEPGEE